MGSRRAFFRSVGAAPLGMGSQTPTQAVALQITIPQCPMCLVMFDVSVRRTAAHRPVEVASQSVRCWSCGWTGTAQLPQEVKG